jgi:hypothetical protein
METVSGRYSKHIEDFIQRTQWDRRRIMSKWSTVLMLHLVLHVDEHSLCGLTKRQVHLRLKPGMVKTDPSWSWMEREGIFSWGGKDPLRLNIDSEEIWKRYISHIKSPLWKTVYVKSTKGLRTYKSGLSALSGYSDFIFHGTNSYAVDKLDFHTWKKKGNKEIFLEPKEGCVELELWHYCPSILNHGISREYVDPLSLFVLLTRSNQVNDNTIMHLLNIEDDWV